MVSIRNSDFSEILCNAQSYLVYYKNLNKHSTDYFFINVWLIQNYTTPANLITKLNI